MLTCVPQMQKKDGSCFCNRSISLYHFIGELGPMIFKGINDQWLVVLVNLLQLLMMHSSFWNSSSNQKGGRFQPSSSSMRLCSSTKVWNLEQWSLTFQFWWANSSYGSCLYCFGGLVCNEEFNPWHWYFNLITHCFQEQLYLPTPSTYIQTLKIKFVFY